MDSITAIFDDQGGELFPTAGVLKVDIAPSNTFAKHIIEDGTVVTDNAIINQVRISLTIILDSNDYQEVYKSIQDASRNKMQLRIQTKVSTFDKMYIESYPSKEDANMFDTVSLTINLIEQITGRIKTKKLDKSDVANQADTDTEERGEQLPKESESKTALQKIAEYFK